MTRLYIPGVTRDEEEPLYICTVPTGGDDLCGRCFYAGEERAFQAHVGKCARANMDHIMESRTAARAPAFDPENWDKEVEEHMAKVGERMKKEGRLTVRPDEKAGF